MRLFTPLNLTFAAIGLIATVFGYVAIPAGKLIAVRWGLDMQPTATAPKELALLQMPAAMLVVWLLFWIIGRYGNRERDAVRARTLAIVLPVLVGLLAAMQVAIVLVGR